MKLLSLVSLTSSLALFIQAPANPLQQQRPQGSIEGIVTRQGSGQPIPNTLVTVTRRPGQPAAAQPNAAGGARGASALPPIPPVMTDEKGKFAVQGLDEGIYNVLFQANGYVAQRYGRFTGGNGTPVTVTGGQASKDVDVELTPAANIGGRIHDLSDQPLVNLPVVLLRASMDSDGRRTYETVGAARTNDRGEYRMYWVTPGRYYLLAGSYSTGGSPRFLVPQLVSGGANASSFPDVAGYAFYPAVTEISEARVIALQPGTDLRSVDVAVTTRSRTFSIRGEVIDSRTGKAPRTANVFAEPQGVGLGPVTASTDYPSPAYRPSSGTFEIRNLLPGTYSVVAMVQALRRPEPPMTEASATVTVTVTDSDANGVKLAVVPGATIVGRLRVEGELPAQGLGGRPLVSLTKLGGAVGFEDDVEPGFLEPDGSFRLHNVVAGDYQFRTGNFQISTVGFIKEARLDGADVLNVPLRISGSSEKQLELVLRVGGGRLAGTVADVRSQPVAGARVVLVPDRARFRTDLYRTVFTGQMGRFTFARVAPGDYKVFSWESLEENGWLDPEILARFEQRGVSIHVTESSDETINVQMISGDGSR